MDTTSFNTRKASNIAIFDLDGRKITVAGKLDGRSAQISSWQGLSYETVSEAGYLILSNYKVINSTSSGRFAYAIYDSAGALLYVDTVAEANSGAKKYSSLFGNGQPTASQHSTATAAPTSASASSFSWNYEQVIGLVDAISIDGKKVFTQKATGTFNGPDPNSFFCMEGAVLFWLWVIQKTGNSGCLIKIIRKKYAAGSMLTGTASTSSCLFL